MTSAAPATWANWGLYSIPVDGRGHLDDVGEAVAHLAQQPLDEAADDAALDLGERADRLHGRAGAAEHVVDARHGRGQRDLEDAVARHRLGGELRQVRRRLERVDVLGVRLLARSRAAAPGRPCAGRREDRRRLAGEAVEAELKDPRVLAGQLDRSTEVVGDRVAGAGGGPTACAYPRGARALGGVRGSEERHKRWYRRTSRQPERKLQITA